MTGNSGLSSGVSPDAEWRVLFGNRATGVVLDDGTRLDADVIVANADLPVSVITFMIEASDLTKRYSHKRGITGVSFQVDEGEIFGFLGPNGAGKTTSIRLLMALLRANAGSARIAGLDVWHQSVAIKKLVGYLPGEPALDPNLTGGQILEYFGHLRGGVDQSYLKQLIERLELDPTRKFRHYSSGNKRKVVLIQAFMHRPRLLLLDEPTREPGTATAGQSLRTDICRRGVVRRRYDDTREYSKEGQQIRNIRETEEARCE